MHTNDPLELENYRRYLELTTQCGALQPVYHFADGDFTFWTAYYGSMYRDQRICFRVRVDTFPEERAMQKNIKWYDRLLPSFPYEIMKWMEEHPTYQEIN